MEAPKPESVYSMLNINVVNSLRLGVHHMEAPKPELVNSMLNITRVNPLRLRGGEPPYELTFSINNLKHKVCML